MFQQQNQTAMQQTPFPEDAWANTVLCDLKRVVREYATAATESSCPEVRKMFTSLTNSTLQMQGELFNAMQQANMYAEPSPALRQDIQKNIASFQQKQQQTQQFLHQRMSGQAAQPPMQPQAQSQQPYMQPQMHSPQQYVQPQIPQPLQDHQRQHFYS